MNCHYHYTHIHLLKQRTLDYRSALSSHVWTIWLDLPKVTCLFSISPFSLQLRNVGQSVFHSRFVSGAVRDLTAHLVLSEWGELSTKTEQGRTGSLVMHGASSAVPVEQQPYRHSHPLAVGVSLSDLQGNVLKSKLQQPTENHVWTCSSATWRYDSAGPGSGRTLWMQTEFRHGSWRGSKWRPSARICEGIRVLFIWTDKSSEAQTKRHCVLWSWW